MRLHPPVVTRFIWRWPGVLAAGAFLVAGSLPAAAEDARYVPAKRPAQKAAGANVRVISIPLQECPADDNEGTNAMKAFIDPATGELRAPTADEEAALARAIAPAAARRAQARAPMFLPNGLVSYELGEEGMVDAVARLGADGKPVFSCTPRSETPKALTRPLAPKGEAAREEK